MGFEDNKSSSNEGLNKVVSRREALKIFGVGAAAATLAACTPKNQSPENQNTQSSEIPNPQSPTAEVKEGPNGNYILVKYNSVGALGNAKSVVNLFFNNTEVSRWDLEFDPLSPDEPTQNLYFTSENSRIDSRNQVNWDVKGNSAEVYFNGSKTEDIPVWKHIPSEGYTKLEKTEE